MRRVDESRRLLQRVRGSGSDAVYRNIRLDALLDYRVPAPDAPVEGQRAVIVVDRDRRGGHSFDDDVVVLRTAVFGGGPLRTHGFAVSRDQFRDHWRKRSHEVGFFGPLARKRCRVRAFARGPGCPWPKH